MPSPKQSAFFIVGAMSGTSLDGLDLVLTKFEIKHSKWQFEILKAETFAYPEVLLGRLRNAIDSSLSDLKLLDVELGKHIGERVRRFSTGFGVDFIASHGHTVFHKPSEKYTLQIGEGSMISTVSGLPVINNFRVNDVMLGGQGAPLVPIGDRDLFHDFDFCLNLGGIANVSFDLNDRRLAFDICPFNMALNDLAAFFDLSYDEGGTLASKGKVNTELLNRLSEVEFLKKAYPKSLGLEDYRDDWLSIIEASNISIEDKMCTYVEHAAYEISKVFNLKETGTKVLVTGGGTFHEFFMSRLRQLSRLEVCVPNSQIINFKEALVFAYLGLLRFLEQPNCLSSVTGAKRDNSGGDLHGF